MDINHFFDSAAAILNVVHDMAAAEAPPPSPDPGQVSSPSQAYLFFQVKSTYLLYVTIKCFSEMQPPRDTMCLFYVILKSGGMSA